MLLSSSEAILSYGFGLFSSCESARQGNGNWTITTALTSP